MSLLNIDQLQSSALISHYVVQCRGQGHFLPYADHKIIEDWLSVAADPDDLLLILAEILPSYFEIDRQAGRPPRSLSGVRSRVHRRLKDQLMRRQITR